MLMQSSPVRVDAGSGPYADSIRKFFLHAWPHTFENQEGDAAEMILNAILASGRIRLGPKPPVQVQANIMVNIELAIAREEAINIVVPWGARKPASREIVDLAEVAALHTLSQLRERVLSIYQHGIVVYIRLEDASAPWMYTDTGIDAAQDSEIYGESFEKLVRVLGIDWVKWRNETLYVTPTVFTGEATRFFWPLLHYIEASEGLSDELRELTPEFEALSQMGWQGTIPDVQRNYYRDTYKRLYNTDYHGSNVMLARYFAAAKARRHLNLGGNRGLEQYIELAFNEPVPGEPQRGKRIHYRTLPEHVSRIHIAPWRAKGYLAMREDGARVRLTGWGDRERRYERVTERRYERVTTILQGEKGDAEVQTDYEIV